MDGILDAAQAVFCEKGYDGTAVSGIAARLGVVEGTVFKYFPTKRELLVKVLERWYLRMSLDYSADLAGIEGARARLRLLVWRHLRSLRDNPQLCRLMFREVRAGADYRGSRLHGLNRAYTGLLTAVIDEGVKAGEFRAGLPVLLIRDMVYGGIEHHAWNYLQGRGRLDVDAVTKGIMAILDSGVVANRVIPSVSEGSLQARDMPAPRSARNDTGRRRS